MSAIKERSSGAVLFFGNPRKYLLLQYAQGHWDFPKGHVEEGETDKQTLVREVKEETSIENLEIVPEFNHTYDYYYRRGREIFNKTVIWFIAKCDDQKVKLSHEHKDFTWLEYEDAYKKLTFDNAKNLLKKAHEFMG